MLSMLCLVVVFGVHSFVDWTWYVPGDAFVALVCAGWLAGRGPLEPSTERVRWPRSLREIAPMRVGVATAAVIAALLAAWSQWQPQRSANASQEALALLASNPHVALTKAQTAVARDPLSAQALIVLAAVQQSTGEPAPAKATLQRAVRLQPSNPQTWLALARHDLASEPAVALKELQAAIYLNPESIAPEAIAPPYPNPESVEIYDDYVQALRATGTAGVAQTARSQRHVGSLAAVGTAARLRARAQARVRALARAQARAHRGGTTSASARPGPAAAAALLAARRRGAPKLP